MGADGGGRYVGVMLYTPLHGFYDLDRGQLPRLRTLAPESCAGILIGMLQVDSGWVRAHGQTEKNGKTGHAARDRGLAVDRVSHRLYRSQPTMTRSACDDLLRYAPVMSS